MAPCIGRSRSVPDAFARSCSFRRPSSVFLPPRRCARSAGRHDSGPAGSRRDGRASSAPSRRARRSRSTAALDEAAWTAAPAGHRFRPGRAARRASRRPKPPKSESCSTPTRCTSASVCHGRLGQAVDHQRHSKGLHARRAGQLRGRARHVRRSPERLRVRHQSRRRAKSDTQIANEGRDVNTSWDGVWTVATKVRRRRLDRRNADSVQDAPVRARRRPYLGRQFQPADPSQQRGRLLVADSARLQPVSRQPRRHARGASGRGPGTQPAREALGRRQRDACAGGQRGQRRERGRRREVRRHAITDARRDGDCRISRRPKPTSNR